MPTTPTVLLNDDNRHRDYTGVTKFHNLGYYGERVRAATGESWGYLYYNPAGMVIDPMADSLYASESQTHGMETAATFFQVAPASKLISLSFAGRFMSGGAFESTFIDDSIPIIQSMGITNMFNSFTQTGNDAYFQALQQALNNVPNFKCYFSAGNDDTDDYNKVMQVENVFGVGAYKIMVSGEIVLEGYSSESEYVDFAAPSMIYTNLFATSPDATAGPHSGTSFSAPWLCGMSCLVDDFFIDRTGYPLSREAMRQFMIDCSEDIGDSGMDVETGHGAPRLPDPEDIVISNYTTHTERVSVPVLIPSIANESDLTPSNVSNGRLTVTKDEYNLYFDTEFEHNDMSSVESVPTFVDLQRTYPYDKLYVVEDTAQIYKNIDGVWCKLGTTLETTSLRKYAQTIGNGAGVGFTITHNLDTKNIFVSAYNLITGQSIKLDYTIVDEYEIDVDFEDSIPSNSIRVIIFG